MIEIFIAPGVRTPFVKGGGVLAQYDALALATPIAKAMAKRARPDFIVWSQVIPDPTVSNIARELVFAAGLDPEIPAFSTVLACSSSFMGVIEAAGMIGRGGARLGLVGGVETMSHVPIALRTEVADRHVRPRSRRGRGSAVRPVRRRFQSAVEGLGQPGERALAGRAH
jgi:acetyl-CoA acetyltransferase